MTGHNQRSEVHEELDQILIGLIHSESVAENKEALWAIWGGPSGIQILRKIASQCSEAFSDIMPHRVGIERRIMRFLEAHQLIEPGHGGSRSREDEPLYREVRDWLEHRIYNPQSLKKAIAHFDPQLGPLTHWLWTRSYFAMRDWLKHYQGDAAGHGTVDVAEFSVGVQPVREAPVLQGDFNRRERACVSLRGLPHAPPDSSSQQAIVEESLENAAIPEAKWPTKRNQELTRCLELIGDLERAIQLSGEHPDVLRYLKEQANGQNWQVLSRTYQEDLQYWREILLNQHQIRGGDLHLLETTSEELTQQQVKARFYSEGAEGKARQRYAMGIRQLANAHKNVRLSTESRRKMGVTAMFRPDESGDWQFVAYARYPKQKEIGKIIRMNHSSVSRALKDVEERLDTPLP